MRRVLGQIFAGPSFVFVLVETLLIAGICLTILHPSAVNLGAVPTGTATVTLGLPAGIMVLMYSAGLYDREALFNLKRAFWRAALITGPIFGLAVLTTGLLARNTNVPIYPYRWEWTVALTGIWLLSALVLRFIFHGVHRSGYLTRPIIFLGHEREATELSELAIIPASGFRIATKLLKESDDGQLSSAETLLQCAAQAGASEIVVGLRNCDSSLWDALLKCRLSGLRIIDYRDFCESEGGRISIDAMTPEWLALSRGFRFSRSAGVVRRLADVTLALATLLATAPLLMLTAIAVKLQDGGPVFYRQERVGVLGKTFVLIKFRSMRRDAEPDGPVWATERDSRITPIGRLLRKVRIDELPQFLNVLLGDMTLIGPRPERPCFVRQFSQSIPFYDCRHLMKPGITGWAQVSFRYGASLEDAKRKLSYDLYYVKNRGLKLDLLILLKTIGVVVRGDGAR